MIIISDTNPIFWFQSSSYHLVCRLGSTDDVVSEVGSDYKVEPRAKWSGATGWDIIITSENCWLPVPVLRARLTRAKGSVSWFSEVSRAGWNLPRWTKEWRMWVTEREAIRLNELGEIITHKNRSWHGTRTELWGGLLASWPAVTLREWLMWHTIPWRNGWD